MIDDIIVKLLPSKVNALRGPGNMKESAEMYDENKNSLVPPMESDFRQPITSQVANLYGQVVRSSASMLASVGKILAFLISFASSKNDSSNVNDSERDPINKLPNSTGALGKIHAFTPLTDRKIWGLLSNISHINQRNPLLSSSLAAASLLLSRSQVLSDMFSRATSYYLKKYVCNEMMITRILKSVRQNLFPNNGNMGPPRTVPTTEEQIELHNQAIESIIHNIPDRLRPLLLGSNPYEELADILDVFSEQAINKHLIYSLLDFIILSILPELTEQTPHQLLQKRLHNDS
ncbi:hypothetical protein AWJ20_3007 [Sugiyamaella lignohabitans]|uniref:Sorting nexin C-terminal domain-containing protein n=1 Tax=Sugiyamaella lignohabitans TaxID=796027 RepID=A0A161HHC0_9ASCO|nr:uncharacterized protein AWJ20_3007 [Sugiyamaella lignohabitans]ANB15380.1 hypothetical protein AWJ20_3007 [Sugiyamaella lignohabitans]